MLTREKPENVSNKNKIYVMKINQECCSELCALNRTTYPSALLKILHGWVVNWFARSQLGGVNELAESSGHILNGINDHHLRVGL